MRKVLSKYELMEGAIPPKWYGASHYDVHRMVIVYYPVPINKIVSLARNIWFWLRRSIFCAQDETRYLRADNDRLRRENNSLRERIAQQEKLLFIVTGKE